MKTTIRLLIFLLFFLVMAFSPVFSQGLPKATPEEVGLSSKRLERINDVMRQFFADERISGAVTLVARHGKVAHFGAVGYYDIEAKKPMSGDTIFRIASMSKPITSSAVMMLYEEGRFLLSDPVSKYIPEFAEPKVVVPDETGESYTLVPAYSEITIRNLLNHTSGISYRLMGHKFLAGIYKEAGVSDGFVPGPSLAENIRILGKQPLANHPGEGWEYGLSTDTLGYLIELFSGMSLEAFLKERLFGPLGMKNTCFHVTPEQKERLAIEYNTTEKGLERVPEEVIPYGDSEITVSFPYNKGLENYHCGGGGICSTATDYALFCQMILNGGKLNGVRILSRKSVEMMSTNSIGDLVTAFPLHNGDKFGLGFGIRGGRGKYDELESIGTLFWTGGVGTHFFIDPKEDMLGVFMTQSLFPDLSMLLHFRVLTEQAIID